MTKKNKATPSKTKNPTQDTWTVRGVTPETRAAAKKAARRAGMSLGAWVDETLRREATDGLKGNLPAQLVEDQLAQITAKLDALAIDKRERGMFGWLRGRRTDKG